LTLTEYYHDSAKHSGTLFWLYKSKFTLTILYSTRYLKYYIQKNTITVHV